MKKILLVIFALTIFSGNHSALANNSTNEKVCIFPNGSRVTTIDNNTTIDFQRCEALKINDDDACREMIESAKEFVDNKTKLRKTADEAIILCNKQKEDDLIMTQAESENENLINTQISTTTSCITNDSSVLSRVKDGAITCQLQNSNSEGLTLLQEVFTNQFVYQLIEPITSENLVIQRRNCTYEFLRNKDGLIQASTASANQTGIERDSDFYSNNLFTITEKSCFITYVDQCDPELVLDARIRIDEELPVSTYCKTYQVISGSSGTGFIKGFVNIIYRLSVSIIGVIAVIVMVINGIRISTAGDDSGAVSEAKERIAQSIFGLAVLFLAWIILRSVNPNFFTTDELQINDPRTPQNQTQEQQPPNSNTNTNAN